MTCGPWPAGSTRRCWPTRALGQPCERRPAGLRCPSRSRPTASGATRGTPRPPCTSASWKRCRTPRNTPARPGRAVALSCPGSHLEFTVTDDGTGFDTAKATHGTGLQGMADRLAAAGGTLRINSAPRARHHHQRQAARGRASFRAARRGPGHAARLARSARLVSHAGPGSAHGRPSPGWRSAPGPCAMPAQFRFGPFQPTRWLLADQLQAALRLKGKHQVSRVAEPVLDGEALPSLPGIAGLAARCRRQLFDKGLKPGRRPPYARNAPARPGRPATSTASCHLHRTPPSGWCPRSCRTSREPSITAVHELPKRVRVSRSAAPVWPVCG